MCITREGSKYGSRLKILVKRSVTRKSTKECISLTWGMIMIRNKHE